MHSFGHTYGQRRRGGGARRPGAARKPGTPTTPTGHGRQKQLSSAAVLRKARKISTDSSRAAMYSSTTNPFHQARLQQQTNRNLGTVAMVTSSDNSAEKTGNPFFAQLARKPATSNPTPFGENFMAPQPPPMPPSSVAPQPPSYANVLKGKAPIPSFITHGPSSIPFTDVNNESHSIPSPLPQVPLNTMTFSHTHQSTTSSAHHTHSSEEPPKTLHLKNLPEHINNPPTLRNHFSRFGEITKLNCQPSKRYATISFSTSEAAVKAKRLGRTLFDEPIQIFWFSRPQQRSNPADPHSHDPRLHSSGMERGHPQLPPYLPKTSPFLIGQPTFQTIHHHGNEKDQEMEKATKQNSSIFPISRKRPAGPSNPESTPEKQAPSKKSTIVREGLNTTAAVEKKSVWSRLGGREGEMEGTRERKEAKSTKGKGKVRRIAGNEEWTPQDEEEEEEQEDDEEGVAEGKDSVLGENRVGVATDDMDTIARSVPHSYYLRSLHQPDAVAWLRGPKATLQLPHTSSEDSNSVSMTTKHIMGVPRNYGQLPIPVLPPPPMPRGQSSADLYQSLDTRDEQIRKSLVKQTSLTTAEVVVGTCPDMCPEKERYMREDRRRLSWYELDRETSEPGAPRVDHQRAVKEYNRSAADKAEDLAHELRPESVLLMTMDYLVTCVLDEGEGKIEAWYDFVWNRTRAIRKDITLQHLCSKGCVELTEKCARFHIMCSYLLCEEEMTVFDQNMNHENLTKCLISLKQFYRDLRVEQNVVCENEAEFCSYDILLHLKDGSVLNTVEQYSPTIRQTSSVRLAVDIALAFSSNNYVKFFKYVRSESCTFLSACIIHRYFIEMHTTALEVMTKAYTHSKPTNFPLSKFTEVLAFESEAMATEFCLHFDLTLTKKTIKLNKEYTRDPPTSLPTQLSPSLVGKKRVNRCLGEVVNGGPLPSVPVLPRPYDSFAPGTPLAPPTPIQATPPNYADQELEVAIGLCLDDVISNELPTVAMEILQTERDNAVKQVTICAFCEDVMCDCVMEECTAVAMTTLSEAQLAWQIREKAIIMEEVGKVVAMEMESGIILEQVSQIVMEIFSDSHKEFVAMVMSVGDDIMCNSVKNVIREVAMEMVMEAETMRQDKLNKLEKQVLKNRQRRYWRRWRRGFNTRRHARECLSAIPSLPPLIPLSAQLGTRRLLGDTVISRGTLDSTGEHVAKLLEKERFELNEKRQVAMAPLDLPSILRHSLLVTRSPSLPPLPPTHHTTPHIYWSLAILHTTNHIPHSEPRDLKLFQYLEQKLKFCPPGSKSSNETRSSLPKQPGVREISISSTPLETGGIRQLKISIKSIDLRQTSGSVFQGVCVLMLLAPTPLPHQTPEDYKDDVIANLMSISGTGMSQIPMLVLAPFHVEENYLAHWNVLRIALQCLPSKPAVFLSDVTFGTLQTKNHTPQQEHEVCKGLKWLADHTPQQPPISCIAIRDYLEQGVQQYFMSLVVRDSEIRKKNGLGSQSPHYIISLYNDVISYLANTAAMDTLTSLSWPPREFAPRHFAHTLAPNTFNCEGLPSLEWNEDHYLDNLRQCIMKYQLVQFDESLVNNASQWSEQFKYCNIYLQEYVGQQYQLLMPRVKALLHGYCSHVTFDQSKSVFPWDHVIITCIDHMMSISPNDLWVTCLHGNGKEFTTPTSWLMAEASTSLVSAHSMTSEPYFPRTKQHRRNYSDSYLFHPHTITTPTLTHKHHITSSRLPIATKLAETIDTEKQLSSDFENQLKRFLSDGEELAYSPHLSPLSSSPTDLDHTPVSSRKWAGPLEVGLKLLRMKIRTSQFQEKVDFNKLQLLTQTHTHSQTLM